METKKSNMGTKIKMIFMQQLCQVINNIKSFIKKQEVLYNFLRKLYIIITNIILILKKIFFKFIDRNIDNQNLNINIGGGRWVRRHWKVLDFPSQHYNYYSAIIDYKHDLTSNKPFPFPDNSVCFFYSSHTFEHIPQEFCQYVFNEIYRCLKPGGGRTTHHGSGL